MAPDQNTYAATKTKHKKTIYSIFITVKVKTATKAKKKNSHLTASLRVRRPLSPA